MVFIVFVLKSGQTTITVTCALKNQYENLPDWLGKYVGMKKKLGGGYNFSSLYGLLCFWVIYALKRRRADSRDLIKKVYFAMKIQISRLSARCPLMVCIGNNDKWPAPIYVKWQWNAPQTTNFQSNSMNRELFSKTPSLELSWYIKASISFIS